ncbi:arylsulfatase B-like [Ruditapes philippinarum]|uniref:arylsulfatase B-like n=1 Tax=Ruditapes philippinarum TaxID=129788 RepID=UPI00295BE010|nr:arylsulfatase B-like [Ruditapes philippinarum]
MKLWITSLILNILMTECLAKMPPHIIFIVADDLGWNDVGWHNPEMHTPNLDNLARQGVILDSSYVQQVCTPSRNCFMTGLYPFHTGLQHSIIKNYEARALPEQFETLPEKLKTLGYSTHIIGKWHLGYCNWKYTPTYRGFDSFYGYYGGAEGYFSHKSKMRLSDVVNMTEEIIEPIQVNHVTKAKWYDFRFNKEVFYPKKRTYSTKLFSSRVIDIINESNTETEPLYLYIAFQSVHGPFQVPKRYKKWYPADMSENRRTYCGMVSALDEAVGDITDALETKGIMDNAVIVFTTDNGGHYYAGSNLPLRGYKGSLWEGGTRGVAFVYSPTFLKKSSYVNKEMIHAVDWFPTLLHVAGGTPDRSLDGVNQWKTISEGRRSSREDFVYCIDDIQDRWAYRFRNFKLMYGQKPDLDNRWKVLRLFDIEKDPFEQEDIAEKNIDIVEELKRMLNLYRDTQVPANYSNVKEITSLYRISKTILSPGWC